MKQEAQLMREDSSLVMLATYNEKENIEPLIYKLLSLPIPCNLLIIDDDSPDGTGQLADELARKIARLKVLHREAKNGLAQALTDGFEWGVTRKYDFIVNLDADLSHSPSEIPAMIEAMKFADVTIGSRYIGGTRVVNWPLHRLILSKLGGHYVRIITGMKMSDPTSGFRCYRRNALENILRTGVKSKGYSIHLEMAQTAYRLHQTINEVPITFHNRQYGVSKINWKIIIEALLIVWKLRKNS